MFGVDGPAIRGSLRLLPWLILLSGIGMSGWWRYYLAPSHLVYLWIGVILLAAVLILGEFDLRLRLASQRRQALKSRMLPPEPRHADIKDYLELATHWIPLVLLLVLGPTRLSLVASAGSLDQLRRNARATVTAAQDHPAEQHVEVPDNLGTAVEALKHEEHKHAVEEETPNEASTNSEESTISGQGNDERQLTDTADTQQQAHKDSPVGQARQNQAHREGQVGPLTVTAEAVPVPYRQTDLAQLYINKQLSDGEPVEVAGYLHLVAGDDQLVPLGVDPAGVDSLLYRFVITCCVADAVPAAAILEGLENPADWHERWVMLRGRFHYTGPTQDIPLIRVESIEMLPEPADPYLLMSELDL